MSIEIRGVTKRFGDFVALDDVNVSLPSGELTALLGPSGGGKSTLLRIIAGLDSADEGSVSIEGVNATKLPPQKRNVGFVFQHYAVFKHMTVAKNVAFGLEIRHRPKDEIKRRVGELLDLVHLSQFADRYPAQLSGGQRQRMALARALAVEPSVLLLDEPFGALDAKVRKDLRRWLRDLHDRTGVTTVFVTHDQEEALDLADIVAVMNKGRIEQAGPPRTVFARPETAFVAEFIGGAAKFEGAIEAGRFSGGGLNVVVGLPRGPAVAFVRPHEWSLSGQGGLEARVLNVLEAGPLTRLDCRTASGALLEVALPPGAMPPSRGEQVRLTAADARVFAL